MNKRFIVPLLFFIIVLTGCMSPEKAIEKFEQSIEEKNAEALFKLVNIESDVYWTEKEAEDMMNYFVENQSAYTAQLDLLHAQKEAFKEKKDLDNTKGILYFDDKKKLFIRTYEVSLSEESYVDFHTLTISVIDDKELTEDKRSNENVLLGLFGPGNYHVQAVADYRYVVLEDEANVELFDDENFNEAIVLDLKGEEATVFSTVPGVDFFIDGEKIEQDISASEGATIQPLVEGLILQSKVSFAWGELVSEEVEYAGPGTHQIYFTSSEQSENEIDLTPHAFANEAEREEIAQIITDFNGKLLTGLAKNDPSYLKNVAATDEAIAGYDDTFDLLDSVVKGTASKADFSHLPAGYEIVFMGQYQGGLKESIIDFTNAENIKDEETDEDLLLLKVNLKTDFFYIPEGYSESDIVNKEGNYLEPIIHLKKENDKWIITEQMINLKENNSLSGLTGDNLVVTKAK